MFHPKANEVIIALNNKKTPIAGETLVIAINAAALYKPKGRLIEFFIGKSKLNLIPDNLRKATIDPVKVTPPMKTPK